MNNFSVGSFHLLFNGEVCGIFYDWVRSELLGNSWLVNQQLQFLFIATVESLFASAFTCRKILHIQLERITWTTAVYTQLVQNIVY